MIRVPLLTLLLLLAAPMGCGGKAATDAGDLAPDSGHVEDGGGSTVDGSFIDGNVVPATYSLGGTVAGLVGAGLVLQYNGAHDLAITSDGSFTFSPELASGTHYSVTVKTQPLYQTCATANGSGTMGEADVTAVAVTCHNNQLDGTATLASDDLLAVAVADVDLVGSTSLGLTAADFAQGFGEGTGYAAAGTAIATTLAFKTVSGEGVSSVNIADLASTIEVSLSYSGSETLDACLAEDPFADLVCSPGTGLSFSRQELSQAMDGDSTALLSVSVEKDNFPAVESNSLPVRHYRITQVSDLNSGADDVRYPGKAYFTEYNAELYFVGLDSAGHTKLFKYTGSSIVKVSDITTGADDAPRELTVYNGQLYFAAYSAGADRLYRTDGSTVTRFSAGGRYPKDLFVSDDSLLFAAYNAQAQAKIFRYDGTNINQFSKIFSEGHIADISPFYDLHFCKVGPTLFFAAKNQAGLTKLYNYDHGDAFNLLSNTFDGNDDAPAWLTSFSDGLYFTALNASGYRKLFSYKAGVIEQLADFNNGENDWVEELLVYDNTLYLRAPNADGFYKLFKFDGTSFTQVSDINSGDDNPAALIVYRNELFFSAMAPDLYTRIFKYDLNQVVQVSHINTDGDSFSDPAVFDDTLVFVGRDADHHTKIFKLE